MVYLDNAATTRVCPEAAEAASVVEASEEVRAEAEVPAHVSKQPNHSISH